MYPLISIFIIKSFPKRNIQCLYIQACYETTIHWSHPIALSADICFPLLLAEIMSQWRFLYESFVSILSNVK